MPDANSAFLYTVPRSVKTHMGAIDEDPYARSLLEKIPGLYNSRMTDEEFEIFSRLDGGVRLEAREPDNGFYNQSGFVDSGPRYFDDEDLYRRLEDQYDYPQGVDEEDAHDTFDEQALFDGDDTWAYFLGRETDDEEDPHLQVALEEAIINARYFDANDLYDREDFGNSVYGEEKNGLEQQEFEDDLEDGPLGRKGLSGCPIIGSQSSLRKEELYVHPVHRVFS